MTRFTPLWEQAGSYAASVDRRLIGAIWPSAWVSGCVVTVAAGTMNMNIAAGAVVAPAANNTGSVLCYSDAVEVVTSPTAPAAGTNRYDVAICQPRGNDLDGGTNNDFVFSVVSGTASASPTVPATPAGAVALGQILVIGGAATLSSANLIDMRALGGATGQRLLAYVQSTSNFGPTSGTTETLITPLVTPQVYIPSATRVVRLEAFFRNSLSGGGDAIFFRMREGATTAGTQVQDCIENMTSAGPQVGTGSSTTFSRTYQPGIGLKQWCMTIQGVSAAATATATATSPMWFQVRDMGG